MIPVSKVHVYLVVLHVLFSYINIVKTENQSQYNTKTLEDKVDSIPSNSTKDVVIRETSNNNATQKFVSCIPLMGNSVVEIVNDTELIRILTSNPNVTSKETPATCVVVLFYSKFCPFSSMAAPHFNALPRAFPDIKMVAVNAMIYHLFNTQNGIIGVPSIVLFHNGRPITKYNESEYTLASFSRFITKHTGMVPKEDVSVTDEDFEGPVSSIPEQKTDIFLVLSWIFIIICGTYFFTRSKYWKWIVETAQNTWMESEAQAQHEHND
ncbi:thioredoxin domain-containing protein 15 [Agrilus planipennis]|uniref:Thioredoxin domain-containing protein 15 n=1 Tax=Agrilus planipennis TaxID=224129 RepID=A0A1W4WUN2_AGRPL|nr:thioredoxin domain-containing protein 15 [Agrilus planipennis]